MMPLPAAVLANGPWLVDAWMLTTAGSTLATTWATSSESPASCEDEAVCTTVVLEVGDGSSSRVTTPPAEPATRATPRNAAAIRHGLRRRGGGGGVVCSGGVQAGGGPGAQGSASGAGGSSTADCSRVGMACLRFLVSPVTSHARDLG